MEEDFIITGDYEVGLPSFLDFYYDFMKQRYQIQTIAFKATHDIFTELQSLENHNEVYFDSV